MDHPTKLALWPHQAQAVRVVASFLSRRSVAASTQAPATLVNIPTGGGKTAVIGALAHWHSHSSSVLVLAPRQSIRRQLAEELSAKRGFFSKRGYASDTMPKRVMHLRSVSDLPTKISAPIIFVATIQLIARMKSKDPKAYKRLSAACQCVFVDEGHYEPAFRWCDVIRGLARPVILVTATPYRNDFKAFSIDPRAIYITSYDELVQKHFLRPVHFEPRPSSAAKSAKTFVSSVLDAFVKQYGEPPSFNRKLIIRCRRRQAIQQVCDAIRAHKYGAGGVLGVHERFGSEADRPWEKKQPADPEQAGAAAIWVHQYKLLEGVDGPSFRALAVYGRIGSARAVVQQIGRIVRNPDRDPSERSLVVDHSAGALQGMWNRFREYDAELSAERIKTGRQEFEEAIQSFAPIVYADRQFRKRLTFSGIDKQEVLSSIRLPSRCHLYALSRSGSVNQLRVATSSRFLEEDYPFAELVAESNRFICIFAKITNSPLLANHYFLEPELHVLIAQRSGDVVAILDTSRAGLDMGGELAIGSPLGRTMLVRLLAGTPNVRLTEVNTRSAVIGPSAVRRRMLTAVSLEETPPLLDEFQFVASSIGAADNRDMAMKHAGDGFDSRSLGFARARISDTARRLSIADWIKWANRLSKDVTNAGTAVPAYLGRYAEPLEHPPSNAAAQNVLLDTIEAREHFVVVDASKPEGEDEPLEFDDVCLDCAKQMTAIGETRNITVKANGVDCMANIDYDSLRGIYRIVSPQLERRYRHRRSGESINVVDFLNSNQDFIVIPDEPNVIYTERGFYAPGLRTGPSFDPTHLGLKDLLIYQEPLRSCATEKGRENSATPASWEAGSVFRWIDDNPDLVLPGADLIICDDGRRECCDFLFAGNRNGQNVVVLVHAKRPSQSAWVSAGALYDICGQANKQVASLSLFRPLRPTQVADWQGAWTGTKGEGTVSQRIRRQRGIWHNLNPNDIWGGLERQLERQSTEREVVLVLGAALNPDCLFDEAKRTPATTFSIHALHLIRSTVAAVFSAGAKLRVLCG